MLAEETKASIQTAYKQLLHNRSLTPRYGQRWMIAEISKTLASLGESADEQTPIIAVEAGTGTGKTLAYLLASLPLAQSLGYRVVVATATIALQEQVVFKDIPEIQKGSDLDFSVSLAKGRGRYVCLAKLDLSLRDQGSLLAMQDLYGENLEDPLSGNRALYGQMLEALGAAKWDGDRDNWEQPITEADWRPVTVDRYQCSGPRCSFFRNCSFFQARNALDKGDCIVANHDLVLTDLALGGGAILPDPGRCIYIFDEAHHLPIKSNTHFSAATRLRGSGDWLERCKTQWQQLEKADFLSAEETQTLRQAVKGISRSLEELWTPLAQLLESAEPQSRAGQEESNRQYTFDLGFVPEEVQLMARNLASQFSQLLTQLDLLADSLKQDLDEASDLSRSELAAQWFPQVGSQLARAETNVILWRSFAEAESDDASPPRARWLTQSEADDRADISLASSPILAAENLQQRLWDSCAAAVLTSATLSSLGSFDSLAMRAGLPDHTRFLRIPSPFQFDQAATLSIPRMRCEPSDSARHTELIVRALPQLLRKDSAALMLFSSRRQMLDVLQGLPNQWRDLVLCQDDYQKAQLLKYHRQRVDKGDGSIIFGLASFAEGVDLPGDYCTHVLIAKIPFAVPNDPIEVTLSAWVEQQGKNAFMTLAVPDAAFRLVQASGRLLRSETDSGTVTLFDERIVNRRYGKAILDSLPPYRREIFERDISA